MNADWECAGKPLVVLTIGHSTRPLDEFIGLIRTFRVEEVVDVRSVPRSRHNPQFNMETLPAALHEAGILYAHAADLGGLRHATKESPNAGWRNASFRGYADYMQTEKFRLAIEALVAYAEDKLVALMCAEALPWRCHRSLIADALTLRGFTVKHIMSATRAQVHELTTWAKIDGLTITYPAPAETVS